LSARVLLDGAMGTALIDAGLPPGCLPEAWLVARPEAIARVHAAHAAAGAEVVLTCTFNLAAPRLAESGVESGVGDLARRAVAIARSAAPGARVAGALGPTLLADGGEAAARYAPAFGALGAAGCDLLWAESQLGLDEALAALAAARATGLPVAVTFALQEAGGALRSSAGEPALECFAATARAGAAAVGANCVLPGAPLAPALAAAEGLGVPLVAKPSAGLPGALVAPEAFGGLIGELLRAGASWVGGCCGAGDAHLRAAARQLQARG
jgi:5-methyltetrahydrofolate--homocysteine methyltransferase